MCAVERAVEIEVDIAVPLFRGHLAHFAEDALAGIVDQDVERGKAAVASLKKSADLLEAGDVAGEAENSAQGLHFLGGALGGCGIAAADSHRSALPQQALGYGSADSTCASCDNRGPAAQWLHIVDCTGIREDQPGK